MIRLGLITLVLATFYTNLAKGEVFRTLSCDYEGVVVKFSIEADMTSAKDFAGKALYYSGDSVVTYPLFQKSPRKGEKLRFVLDEPNWEHSLLVQVYQNEQGGFFRSEATFLGIDLPSIPVEGSCFFY